MYLDVQEELPKCYKRNVREKIMIIHYHYMDVIYWDLLLSTYRIEKKFKFLMEKHFLANALHVVFHIILLMKFNINKTIFTTFYNCLQNKVKKIIYNIGIHKY